MCELVEFGRLEVWTVEDHPPEYPDFYIVRRLVILGDGQTVQDPQWMGFSVLDIARAFLESRGLTRLDRNPDDEPTILERWI